MARTDTERHETTQKDWILNVNTVDWVNSVNSETEALKEKSTLLLNTNRHQATGWVKAKRHWTLDHRVSANHTTAYSNETGKLNLKKELSEKIVMSSTWTWCENRIWIRTHTLIEHTTNIQHFCQIRSNQNSVESDWCYRERRCRWVLLCVSVYFVPASV